MIHPVRRSVAVHQVAVKQAKEGHLISKATLRACQEAAKKRIPEILSKFSSPLASFFGIPVPLNASLFFCAYCLKTAVEKKDQWSFYGHLTAYWASIYWHQRQSGWGVQEPYHQGGGGCQEDRNWGQRCHQREWFSLLLSLSLSLHGFLLKKKKTLLAVSADISPQDQPGLRCHLAGPWPGRYGWLSSFFHWGPPWWWVAKAPTSFFHIQTQLLQEPQSIFSGGLEIDGLA